MKPVHVTGIGVWTPGYASAQDWVDRRYDPAATHPPARLLNSRIGRYTSLLTRMALEVIEQAANQAGLDPGKPAMVFGSANGEIQIAIEQLDMIRQEGVPSPARFKNSVHNTAVGHAAIATGNMNFSTAIAAGSSTLAMSLLEVWVWLETHGGDAIVSVADERLPPFLENVANFAPLGVAVALSADPTPGSSGLRLSALEPRKDLDNPTLDDRWIENPSAPGLLLADALMRRQEGIVALETGGEGWSVDVQVQPEA